MKRRTFLIGTGSTAIGGSALLASGAFTRIEAQRRAKIQVARDPNAYLGLDGCPDSPNASYTNIDGDGHLEIEMSPENPTEAGGIGVNSDSATYFDRVFQVCNNGKQGTCLWIQDDENWPVVDASEVGEEYEDYDGMRRVDFYVEDQDEESLVGIGNARFLPVGECICVGLRTLTKGLVEEDQLFEDLDNEVVIVADEPVTNAVPNGNPTSGDPLAVQQTATSSLAVTDLTDPDLTPEDLAASLLAEEEVGEGVDVVENTVEFTGDDRQGGEFVGGTGIVGFEEGILLSSGQVVDVEGPNEAPNTSTAFGEPGDPDLTDLAGTSTFDAAVLEFEFTVPEGTTEIGFNYVFGSDEYNEFVGSAFNDVFGFFVNGENVALVDDPDDGTLPAAINNINEGQPGVPPTNPHLFINNDPFNPNFDGETVDQDDLLDTEMDGLTVVLSAEAEVHDDEPNTMKLAIADAADAIIDSWVLIQAGSLTVDPEDPDPPEIDPCDYSVS